MYNHLQLPAIPLELLRQGISDEDVNILVGENGSGKSTMLSRLADYFLDNRPVQVIAVANTIHDKFDRRHGRMFCLKATKGKNIVKRTLLSAIQVIFQQQPSRLENLGQVLSYVHYRAEIGLGLKGVPYDYVSRVERGPFSNKEKEEIIFSIRQFLEDSVFQDKIIRVGLYRDSFQTLKQSELLSILKHDLALRKHKIIREIGLYLYKEGEQNPIPVNMASSGELTLISSLMYIATIIDAESIILVDEPENSLHPKWQTEYVKLLADLFYRYQPKIILATHSPMVISGAELNARNSRIFKGAQGNFQLQPSETKNVEEIYEDLFDLTTPENRYLSELVVKNMNLLAEETISLVEFQDLILELKGNSFDPEQQRVLDAVLEMGNRITA